MIRCFHEQVLLERELERGKIDLIEQCDDFNLYDAFRMIDSQVKGRVSAYDIKDSLNGANLLDLPNYSIEDVDLFVRRYDRDEDRHLRFSEFADAFTPLNPGFADKLNARGAQEKAFSQKATLMYRSMWITHQKVEKEAEYIREKLAKIPTFSIYDAFKAIDTNQDG